MKNERKYSVIFGVVVAMMLALFGIRNYIFSPPAGLNVGTLLDFILMVPTLPIWKILDLIPKEPIWVDIILTFIITVVFWTIVGYVVGKIINKTKK